MFVSGLWYAHPSASFCGGPLSNTAVDLRAQMFVMMPVKRQESD